MGNGKHAVLTAAGAAQSITGGRALAEMLRLHGVGPMFGIGGFQLLPFYEAVRELGMAHYLVSDERCAASASDSYARITGRPGVCDATLGPGATNLVTGLVESLNAGVPLVVLTGNTNRMHSGKNMTQESRQTEILRPAVKELIRIEEGRRIPEHIRYAFTVATSGRPGPVVVDIPEDICHGNFDYPTTDFIVDPSVTSVPARRTRPAYDDLIRAAELIAKAKRPVLLVGGGIHLSGAYDALQRFAEDCGIPVAHTLSGKGSIACSHPLSAGLFGRYSRIANDLIESSDCLVVIGCKLGEIATKRYTLPPPGLPLVQVDIAAEEIGRWRPCDIALWSDARAALEDLHAELSDSAAALRSSRRDYIAEVSGRMAAWQKEAADRLQSHERPISIARIVNELNTRMPDDGILVADGGFSAHWTGLLYDTKKAGRHFVVNRGLASIGYGVPGTLGAKIAAPERAVVGITGDGGLNMVLGELETALRIGTAFTLIVLNNAASGYVKALQHSMYKGRYQSSDLSEINYAAIAQAIGCQGIRVEEPAKMASALSMGLAERERPTLIDVVVTRDPAKMLPGVDNRALTVTPGDRPV